MCRLLSWCWNMRASFHWWKPWIVTMVDQKLWAFLIQTISSLNPQTPKSCSISLQREVTLCKTHLRQVFSSCLHFTAVRRHLWRSWTLCLSIIAQYLMVYLLRFRTPGCPIGGYQAFLFSLFFRQPAPAQLSLDGQEWSLKISVGGCSMSNNTRFSGAFVRLWFCTAVDVGERKCCLP